MTTGHWKWQGVASNVVGYEGENDGKTDFINNFCQAISSNEGRCTQCHIGYGWKDKTFNFSRTRRTSTAWRATTRPAPTRRGQTTAGLPDPTVDLQGRCPQRCQQRGVPPRKACLGCHTHAGGDDNVKHGDLSSDMIATTRDYDVHTGTNGANMELCRLPRRQARRSRARPCRTASAACRITR